MLVDIPRQPDVYVIMPNAHFRCLSRTLNVYPFG